MALGPRMNASGEAGSGAAVSPYPLSLRTGVSGQVRPGFGCGQPWKQYSERPGLGFGAAEPLGSSSTAGSKVEELNWATHLLCWDRPLPFWVCSFSLFLWDFASWCEWHLS